MRSSTETIIGAMKILSHDIYCEDGVATAAIAEAADRLEEIAAETKKLKTELQEAKDYADRLVEHKDMVCLPADLANLREANARFAMENHELQEKVAAHEDALRDIALFLSCGGYNDCGLVEFDPALYAKKIKEEITEQAAKVSAVKKNLVDANKGAKRNMNALNICCQKLEELELERDAWKAAHDNQVKLKQIISDRPDLKERAKRVAVLIEERDSWREAAYALGEALPPSWEELQPPVEQLRKFKEMVALQNEKTKKLLDIADKHSKMYP